MYTTEYKLEKLHSLKNEVKDLHPFLSDLFRKIPELTNVEYTHGPDEFGADFVLISTDNLLGGEEYIGVVVKQGSIKQDQDDIERQIKECQITPRKIAGGKKVVVLNQIWIVTNGTISANAREKIKNFHSDKNIKFIWDETLIKLVDKNFPTFWEDVDRNVGNYLSALEVKVKNLNSKFSILDVNQNDIYIDQQLVRIDVNDIKKFRVRLKQKPVKLKDVLANERVVFVEAPMGYGKSKLLRQAAMEYSELKNFSQNKILPIFIDYRDLLDDYDNKIESILDRLRTKEKINHEELNIVLFIDSMDENKIDDEIKVQKVIEFVKGAICYKNIKIVFASRPFRNPLLDEKLDTVLVRFELMQLSMDRIVKFVETLCNAEVITTKLKSDLSKSALFKSLPRSPISAILLSRVLASNVRELPSTLPELYSKYMDLVLGRWEIQKGNSSEKEYETTVIIVRLIAKFMLENDLASIGIGDAEDIISNYLSERETGYTVKSIFGKIQEFDQVINVDLQNNKLNFTHRSFLEFMFAESLFFSYGISAQIENPFALYWGASNYFYLGKLKDCPLQLDKIFRLISLDERERLNKIVYSGSYLLAGYQSPYKVISSCLAIVIKEAAEFFCHVVENPQESPFGNFPKLQLLAIITSLLRKSLEYEFFKKALNELETDLFMMPELNTTDSISAFFVASLRAGLGCEDAFDMLINEKKYDLPEYIQLGIIHVSQDTKNINETIKKLEKNIHRKLKANPQLIDPIYEIPLNKLKHKLV
ncbi:hypothetical protein Meth11DRAFT_2451 [Methylophilaceae bacterium 11]|nr:hypothetical protein Meth11DRAFT_2451 [Methylophilaceae bacterium 11]